MLLLEKWVPALEKLPNILRHGYVMLVVILGFVLFNAESLTQAAEDMGSMFGLTGLPFLTAETVYYLKSYGVLFLAGFLGCGPWVKRAGERLSETTVGAVLEPFALVGLLLICTGYLVDGSFSPFLYFRF